LPGLILCWLNPKRRLTAGFDFNTFVFQSKFLNFIYVLGYGENLLVYFRMKLAKFSSKTLFSIERRFCYCIDPYFHSSYWLYKVNSRTNGLMLNSQKFEKQTWSGWLLIDLFITPYSSGVNDGFFFIRLVAIILGSINRLEMTQMWTGQL